MTHWQASCLCNRLLLGKAYQPLCARVYAAHPSICRSAFLFLMDMAFSEYRHCENIHSRWRSRANQERNVSKR